MAKKEWEVTKRSKGQSRVEKNRKLLVFDGQRVLKWANNVKRAKMGKKVAKRSFKDGQKIGQFYLFYSQRWLFLF